MSGIINSLKTAWACAQLFFECLTKGDTYMMATVYVTLILAGRRDFASVPAVLKPQVKADLEAMGVGELAE